MLFGVGASHTPGMGTGQDCLWVRAGGDDPRPQLELPLPGLPGMTALVDTGSKCPLTHDDPQKFSTPLVVTESKW